MCDVVFLLACEHSTPSQLGLAPTTRLRGVGSLPDIRLWACRGVVWKDDLNACQGGDFGTFDTLVLPWPLQCSCISDQLLVV